MSAKGQIMKTNPIVLEMLMQRFRSVAKITPDTACGISAALASLLPLRIARKNAVARAVELAR